MILFSSYSNIVRLTKLNEILWRLKKIWMWAGRGDISEITYERQIKKYNMPQKEVTPL